MIAMGDTLRSIEKNGVNLNVRMLPEIRARVHAEADVRARNYEGSVSGEKRSAGSYLGVVALLHFLRLPPGERRRIYAEMRAEMDARQYVEEDAAFELPDYPLPSDAPEQDPRIGADGRPATGVLGRSTRPAAGEAGVSRKKHGGAR